MVEMQANDGQQKPSKFLEKVPGTETSGNLCLKFTSCRDRVQISVCRGQSFYGSPACSCVCVRKYLLVHFPDCVCLSAHVQICVCVCVCVCMPGV